MTITYIYNDANGHYLGTITRDIDAAGSKIFRASAGFPNPRPLYGLARLAQRPDAPVLVVEGEKAADAAGLIFQNHVCVTSPFGALSAAKADWSPLHGREVVIWPDADVAGLKYAQAVMDLIPGAKVVTPPDGVPDGWDLADPLPPGVTDIDLAVLIDEAKSENVVNFPGKGKKSTKKKAKDDLRRSVEEAKRERDALLRKIKALLSTDGRTEEEAKLYNGKARELAKEYLDKYGVTEEELQAAMADVAEDGDFGSDIDGDALLDSVRVFLERFVSYPSRHASTAHALWIAHAHMMDIWDSTPRIAFMSPERGSGKTRALEATEFLVPRPVHSVNNSVAYVIRKVADDNGRPTILYDEVDALLGNKSPDKADLLALLNAGHRKGATSGRCIVDGGKVRLEELPAYCALALAGLRDLPDTLASRSILIEMRRRAPDETIEPFRERIHRQQAKPIFYELVAWGSYTSKRIVGEYPEAPTEISDRDADCWEPLLAIADAAGGAWPELARDAAVFLVRRGKERAVTTGVELLQHIYEAFGDDDRLWMEKLLGHLTSRDESPWLDIRGKALTDRGLAERLKPYGIKSRDIRIGDIKRKGYMAGDFQDAWKRYLGFAGPIRDKRDKRDIFDNKNNFVADVADVAARSGKPICQACDGNYGKGCPTCNPKAYGIGVQQ